MSTIIPFHIIAISGIQGSGKSMLMRNLFETFKLEKENVCLTTAEKFDSTSIDDYSLILVDCGDVTTDAAKKIFQKASAIFVPTECEVTKLNLTRKHLENIYALIPKDLVYVILNRYHPEHKIDPSLLKKQLGCNIMGAVVEDPIVEACEKINTAFVVTHPKSLASQYLFQLTKIIRSKKILEKGKLLQKTRIETAGKIIPLKATGTDASVVTQVRPQMFSRFSEEELPKDKRTLLKIKVLKQLTSELNLKKLDTETGNDPKKMAVLREKTRQAALSIMERENITVGDKTETDLFIKEILDEALALGPLEILIADSSITEIMVNRKDQIFIEKNGKIQLAPMSFTSNAQLLGIIERIVAPLGRRIDEKTPYCDARLPDGSRVHAIIPPLALEGPVLTIRKFSKKPLIIADLIRYGSLTEDIADFLRAAIEARLNCVVSGGTGTGKTTLLNVLSSFIPERERIITVEDSAELRLTQPHVLRLEARPPNIEGTGAVTIRDLVRNTLRMRPDRIVVGECRDGAALDMLQAMNTGHDGSLTTVHANNPRDCLSRLETLVMMAGMDLPSRAIREQIASAVHLIVQQTRFSDGSRKITHITEITGMEKEVICSQDIIVFKQKGVDKDGKVIGQYEHTGHVPKFIHELEKMGLRIPKGFFIKRKTDTSPEKKD